MRIGPGDGDDTARIQAALDQVAMRTPRANGHRGALVLAPGVYDIAGTVRVKKSGVVLRGSGSGNNPAVDTILRAPGDTPHQRSVVVLGNGSGVRWRDPLPGTQAAITTQRVLVGERAFDVDHPERLDVGDRVVIRHPSTQAWIDALGGGGAMVVDVAGAEDSWVRDVTALHFGYAAVRVRDSDRITVRESRGLDAVAMVTGGRLY